MRVSQFYAPVPVLIGAIISATVIAALIRCRMSYCCNMLIFTLTNQGHMPLPVLH